ncbi:hypothetical protein B4U80_08420 [Leptotrombidium deliense]|uniref:Uncharacterized protein n=1 Tax=Leptotrombidium deliense TaxID=299467 RepID=A0A443RWC2_9ACAR|nr:hypothetical protein B4U80_08420 [Leptotrombidium deliense]
MRDRTRYCTRNKAEIVLRRTRLPTGNDPRYMLRHFRLRDNVVLRFRFKQSVQILICAVYTRQLQLRREMRHR